jgi:hypothetical protein
MGFANGAAGTRLIVAEASAKSALRQGGFAVTGPDPKSPLSRFAASWIGFVNSSRLLGSILILDQCLGNQSLFQAPLAEPERGHSEGAHFVPEDWPEEVSSATAGFVAKVLAVQSAEDPPGGQIATNGWISCAS